MKKVKNTRDDRRAERKKALYDKYSREVASLGVSVLEQPVAPSQGTDIRKFSLLKSEPQVITVQQISGAILF